VCCRAGSRPDPDQAGARPEAAKPPTELVIPDGARKRRHEPVAALVAAI